jgi:hypothetical protein
LSASILSARSSRSESLQRAVSLCTKSINAFLMVNLSESYVRTYHIHIIKCQSRDNVKIMAMPYLNRFSKHIILCYPSDIVSLGKRSKCKITAPPHAMGARSNERSSGRIAQRSMAQHRSSARLACEPQHHHQPLPTGRFAQGGRPAMPQGARKAPDPLSPRRSRGRSCGRG